MIEKSFIIALIVLSIWHALQEGQVFGKLGDYLEKVLPDSIHQPVFDCAICMSLWYGTVFYWLIPWQKLNLTVSNWLEWPVVIVSAMGFNIIINKWSTD